MITNVRSPRGHKKRVNKPEQYNRALAEAGIIDAFLAENGRIFYPLHAEQQQRDYEKKKRTEKAAAKTAQNSEPHQA